MSILCSGNLLKHCTWSFRCAYRLREYYCIPEACTSHTIDVINPLNAKLNPICYLLALLGAHHILHVSRIRVKLCYGYLGNYGVSINIGVHNSSTAQTM